jgi:hypothetical protein
MEHTRMLTYVNVIVEPWNHNNDGGINDIVIDDLDIMDAFDMVPISCNGTPFSRLLFTTQPPSRRIPQPRRITTTQDHVIDTKVQSVIGPTKKKDDQPIITSTRKSLRIRKIPNWMKDYVLL